MSAYELDDDLVRAWIHFTANEVAGEEVKLREAFEKQLPLPVPTKIGAVVRTERGTLIRVAPDGEFSEWWLMNEAEFSRGIAAHWIPTTDIGRITEVLSEGVDL